MNPAEKLNKARMLLLEAEDELINSKGFCPYEIGFALKSLDEAIAELKKYLS